MAVTQPGPGAAVAALDPGTEQEHHVAPAVVEPVVVVLHDPAPELRHRHQGDPVRGGTEVLEERCDRAGEVVGVALHPAPLHGAEVGVHVPVALVDGDHGGADVAADGARDRRERLAEVALGEVVRALLLGLGGTDLVHGRHRRAQGGGQRAARALPHLAQGAEPVVGGVPLVVAGDADLVETVEAHPRLRAVQRRWGGAHGDRLQRRGPGHVADEAVQPAHALGGTGGGVLDGLHRCEVRAVRHGQAGGVHRAHPALLPQRQQRGERRVQAEEVVLGHEPVGRHRDPRARAVVDRVAVRHDQGQAVGGAAHREHHEDVGGARRRGRCAGADGDDGRAHRHGGAGQAEAAQEAAPAQVGAAELRARAVAGAGSRGAGQGRGGHELTVRSAAGCRGRSRAAG